MVSKLCLLVLTFSMAQVVPFALAQSTSSPQGGLIADSRTAQPSVPEKPATLVTPELRGDIFMAKKMYPEAIEAYKESKPYSAVVLNKTGIAYHQMLKLDTAEKYYRLAIKANPHYPEAVNNLGTIFFAEKNYRRAINEYKKALRINSKTASIWANLAVGYFERNDFKRAGESVQKALELDPNVFENKSSQGVLIQQQTIPVAVNAKLMQHRPHLRGERKVSRDTLVLAEDYPQFVDDLGFA